MTLSATKHALEEALDDLLSIRAPPAAHSAALTSLESVVTRVALASPSTRQLYSAFLKWQDTPTRNIASALLDWLGRVLVKCDLMSLAIESVAADLVKCLRLLQGLLLLHRPSQRFFQRRANLENLLMLLDLARPAHPHTPLLATPKPHPSPVLFPSTPTASPRLDSASSASPLASAEIATQVSLAALDALLCGLVDRPKNMRAFEAVGGLGAIVRVLKDKGVAQSVRIKVIELLFYYLMPEANPAQPDTRPSTSSDMSFASSTSSTSLDSQFLRHPERLPDVLSGAADFVPQTPIKQRNSRSRGEGPATPNRARSHADESSPTRTPCRSRSEASEAGTFGRSSDRSSDRGETTPRHRRTDSASGATTPRAEGKRADHHHRRSRSAVSVPDTLRDVGQHSHRQLSGSREVDVSAAGRSVDKSDMPPPPVPAARRASSSIRRSISQPPDQAFDRPRTPVERTSTPVSHNSAAPTTPTSRSRRDAGTQPEVARSKHLRSEWEKKELLRQVMPNVDALQERFRAMGLSEV
ncbi:hypothetical protein BMF94_6254 [Rhodotorula taiwanensis]|uniref:Cell division control protein 14 n=1 Tax=Rhodotorula taiwanensis TaxID=741276 RepID=A0A2S5B2C8_9BASI|nr:hypothetical protein BMF94_6254 [Rhodotorula taiwanensis]